MARKPRTQRSRLSAAGNGVTQVFDYDEDAAGEATPAAAARQRSRPSAYVAPSARIVDYGYVKHDVVRIAIITVVLVGGMIGLSFTMR
ncbi:MAG: hypothetical protein EXR52_06785 [Dehalococcoidia bacterium]|nr:hypothetical protein [Dehalococcoidia bacterium]